MALESSINIIHTKCYGIPLKVIYCYKDSTFRPHRSGSKNRFLLTDDYNTRNSRFNFNLPERVLGSIGKSFDYIAIKQWNSLPNDIKKHVILK